MVSKGKVSQLKEIFSGVPQGGKWSTDLLTFDVNEIDHAIKDDGELFCYADDNFIWYEVTEENRRFIASKMRLRYSAQIWYLGPPSLILIPVG